MQARSRSLIIERGQLSITQRDLLSHTRLRPEGLFRLSCIPARKKKFRMIPTQLQRIRILRLRLRSAGMRQRFSPKPLFLRLGFGSCREHVPALRIGPVCRRARRECGHAPAIWLRLHSLRYRGSLAGKSGRGRAHTRGTQCARSIATFLIRLCFCSASAHVACGWKL